MGDHRFCSSIDPVPCSLQSTFLSVEIVSLHRRNPKPRQTGDCAEASGAALVIPIGTRLSCCFFSSLACLHAQLPLPHLIRNTTTSLALFCSLSFSFLNPLPSRLFHFLAVNIERHHFRCC